MGGWRAKRAVERSLPSIYIGPPIFNIILLKIKKVYSTNSIWFYSLECILINYIGRFSIIIFLAKVAHAQINLLSYTPCVKKLRRAYITNKKASYTHSVKKNRVRYTCAKRAIITRVFLSVWASPTSHTCIGRRLMPYLVHGL